MSLNTTTLHTQQDLLLDSLKEFYTNTENLQKIINIVNGESKISLRIVDWFVTNYAKKYFTVYEVPMLFGTKEQDVRFKVYNDYKLKLKAYSKKRFDPFCRWDRIVIPYNNTSSVQTTIGQLNFFRWIFNNNILVYATDHYDNIYKSMTEQNKNTKKTKKNYNKFQEIVKTKCVLNFD